MSPQGQALWGFQSHRSLPLPSRELFHLQVLYLFVWIFFSGCFFLKRGSEVFLAIQEPGHPCSLVPRNCGGVQEDLLLWLLRVFVVFVQLLCVSSGFSPVLHIA